MPTAETVTVSEEELETALLQYFDQVPRTGQHDFHLLDVLYGAEDAAYIAMEVEDGEMLYDWEDDIYVPIEESPLDRLLDSIGVPYVVRQHDWSGELDEVRRYYISGKEGLIDNFNFPEELDHQEIGEFLGYPPSDVLWFVSGGVSDESKLVKETRPVFRGFAAVRSSGQLWRKYSRKVKPRPTVRAFYSERRRAHRRYVRGQTYANRFEELDSTELSEGVPRQPRYWLGVATGIILECVGELVQRLSPFGLR